MSESPIRDWTNEHAEFLTVFGIAAILLALVFIQPYYEAREFNRCTGGSATYMTALFTDLRVMECK